MREVEAEMARIKLSDSVIEVPDQTFAYLTERLGSPEYAAAAIRAAREPAYYRQAQQAAAQGTFPQEVVQVANQIGRMGVSPARATEAPEAATAGGPALQSPPASPLAPGPVRPRPVSLQMAAPVDAMGFMRSLGLRAGG